MAMKIAIASGKGGTGKTTLAVSLALSLGPNGKRQPESSEESPPLLLDCDVEAPDAHLFLEPTVEKSARAVLRVPRIIQDRCTLCGVCTEVCQFNALALLGDEVHLFPELCHACGSCKLACPEDAIEEVPREVGLLEAGSTEALEFGRGLLNVGEAMPLPVIRQLKDWRPPAPRQLLILDTPPGTSCPMVETVMETDFVVLVTEPTPCGLHDLELAVEVVRELAIPMGVVVNRDGIGDSGVDEFCATEDIPILLRIPFQREIAEGIARGKTLVKIRPEYRESLQDMTRRIVEITDQASQRSRR